jgi:transcriptional regulator with XRE-family HTH domain
MEEQREELKKMLVEIGPRGRGRPYPKGLLEKVLSYTVARRRQGAQLLEVAEELGLSDKMLTRWLSGRRKARKFGRVEVVAATGGALTVHGPRGLRIEGLDIDGLAELVQRLGV